MRSKGLIPLVLAVVTAAAVGVAAVLSQPLWAALLGGLLMFGYWGLEVLTWRRARDREGLALGLAVGGMGLRLALALGVLVAVGLLAKPAFPTAALSFMACFTAYLGLRSLTYTPPSKQRPRAEAR